MSLPPDAIEEIDSIIADLKDILSKLEDFGERYMWSHEGRFRRLKPLGRYGRWNRVDKCIAYTKAMIGWLESLKRV